MTNPRPGSGWPWAPCYGSPMLDGRHLAEAVADLVRIPSVNPLQCADPAVAGERRLAEYLAERSDSLGASVELDTVLDDRPNLVARFDGDRPETIVIDVHLDTVAVAHMTRDPFDGSIEDGRLYGRGAVDTKATFAIVLDVLDRLRAEGRRPTRSVLLVGTVSEEMGGLLGARHLARRLSTDGINVDRMIIAEPTWCAPVHGHKGGVGLEVCIHGHAAHSSKPELGVNAISAAARVVTAIDAEHERLTGLPLTTAVGRGSVSITEIDGGNARNIVPDICRLYAGRRLTPGEAPEVIYNELSALIIAAAKPARAEIEMANGVGFPAFFTEPDDSFVRFMAELCDAKPETVTYGSNCLAYSDIEVPKVLFGPGSIDQAHQAVEWVEIDQLVQAANVYERLLTAEVD